MADTLKIASDGNSDFTFESANLAYVAGMWSTQLIQELLWHTEPTRASMLIDLSQYRSPGWSWISVLDHQPSLRRPQCVANGYRFRRQLGGWHEPEAKALSYNVQLAHSSAPFGHVTSGTITLEAKVVRITSLSDDVDRKSLLTECNYSLTPEQQQELRVLRLESAGRWHRWRYGEIELGDGGLLILPARDYTPDGDDSVSRIFRRMGSFWHWRDETDCISIVDWDMIGSGIMQLI
ncbi:hypothetical protein F5Y16DRAFT_416234 [Xylariaceae sp. FL0255]|nr:hypothetical protein F5Y16DRAFT_416234 [Xylariaceae sp. FL0255]